MSEDKLKKLRVEIARQLRKFSMDPHHSPLKKQKDREIIGRFIDRLHSTEFDTGGLPYYSKDGLAKHHNKSECLFALVCQVVMHYWSIAENGIDWMNTDWMQVVDRDLKRLETIYSTYDQLKVLGDVKGYCLFTSQLPKPKKGVTDGSEKIESESASQEGSQEQTDEGTHGTGECEETQVVSTINILDLPDNHPINKVMQDNLPELPIPVDPEISK
jgi:hypothetical protein